MLQACSESHGNGLYIKTHSLVNKDITKAPMWTFDVDYVIQNSSYVQLLVLYNCAELSGLRQTSTSVPSYGTDEL